MDGSGADGGGGLGRGGTGAATDGWRMERGRRGLRMGWKQATRPGNPAPPPRQGHVRSSPFPPAPATVTTHTHTHRQIYGMNEVSRQQPKRSTRVHGLTEAQDSSPRCQAVHERHAHDTTTQARNKRAAHHRNNRAWNMHAGLPGPSIQRHSSRCNLHRPSPCSHSVARGGAERLPQQANISRRGEG